MLKDISDDNLKAFGQFLVQRIGLDFTERRLPELRRGVHCAAGDFGFKDSGSFVNWLTSEPLTRDRVEKLASYITVGETYFFRDDRTFRALEENILPELVRIARLNNRILRIWSAGCSTGEEPYSLAILLRRMIPDLDDWHITILATDINAAFLRKASEGVYTEWSFRGAPSWLKQDFFTKTKNGQFRLIPQIRSSVKFVYHNLAEDPYPSFLNNTNAMNMVLCRNVLMYFGPEFREKVIGRFPSCLVDGGWFLVSPAEATLVEHECLETVTCLGTTMYKKVQCMILEEQLIADKVVDSSLPPDGILRPELPFDQPVVISEDFPERPSIEKLMCAENLIHEPSAYERAVEMYKRGRYSEVTATLPSMIEAQPLDSEEEGDLAALLARAYANQGFLSEAQRWSVKATVADKLNPQHYFLSATILQELGLKVEAMQSLQRAIYLDQGFVVAHFALANLARSLKKYQRSRKHLENAFRLLEQYEDEQTLPDSEGITAGRLKEIIRSMTNDL